MTLYKHDLMTKRQWLKEENQYLHYLKDHQPHLVEHFINHLDKGRKSILNKLAESLLREDVHSLYSDSVQLKRIGSVYVTSLLKVYKEWEPFLHQLQTLNIKENVSYRMKSFGEYLILFPIKDELAFRRVILEGDVLWVSRDSNGKVRTASELISLLHLSGEAAEFQKELDNGTVNQSLGYAYHAEWIDTLKKECGDTSCKSSLEYIRMKKQVEPQWSPLSFFEQLSLEGHHLHPGSKTKTGMSPEDVATYSPEFHQTCNICFVAVLKDGIDMTELVPNIIEETFSEIMPSYLEFMKVNKLDPTKYQLLPIHEWQYKHALLPIYRNEIKRGTIIPLESLSVESKSTSSFRTLLPIENTSRFIKLAVNSQMTSTVRSISSQTALNSTVFTNMLTEILNKESQLSCFLPLNEIAGYTYRSERDDQRRNLTVVIRENRENDLDDQEVMITGSSLYASSPFSERTILGELLEEYCDSQHLPKEKGALEFFKDYLSVTIPGFLTLLTKYGVALEGHLQNSVPVFKNGRPVRFYFRDWGGARIFKERLDSHLELPAFQAGSVTMTGNKEEMYSKAHYTIFQSHIGEIIRLLVEASGVFEGEFWALVKVSCEDTFTTLTYTVPANVEEDRAFLYQKEVKHKALTKMRMWPSQEYLYSQVSNPLGYKEK
ncbi:IucA/IucC family protein [Rossellomorea sp. AcN35-11]|nr:IucA/IucC family siderophore biosynthesis protein [Rossellomorea aquimaris]WJV28658.1 IucA/IucC family protein [Rossellomorea sp. AcN35-11]